MAKDQPVADLFPRPVAPGIPLPGPDATELERLHHKHGTQPAPYLTGQTYVCDSCYAGKRDQYGQVSKPRVRQVIVLEQFEPGTGRRRQVCIQCWEKWHAHPKEAANG